MKKSAILFIALIVAGNLAWAQNKFKQLGNELATPNVYRTASGAPGHAYWQQQADYKIHIELDEENRRIYGNQTITYTNNSPDPLNYIWIQLDQNIRAKNSDAIKTRPTSIADGVNANDLSYLHWNFDGGFNIDYVKDGEGNILPHSVNYTMMRVDLPKSLKNEEQFTFDIKWWYNINNRDEIRGRSGYEYFPEDDNLLFVIAQFYPRMVLYSDYSGWQNKQFLGRGEFTLTFGNFDVWITVPADHIVSATGELQNAEQVLTPIQKERFSDARLSDEPVFIVTEKEARENEKSKTKKTKTWYFHAENVRDFAFASSRKFIWDAMGVPFGNRTVMAMSFYPKEGNPLWEQYSTKLVAHTLKVYSNFTFEYPYPVAQSIHAKSIGMEYPMICFNGGRPEPDGTYSERTKYGMWGVIIHEVGHNFFPMIVNSDERQWTWMDEGLNSFLQGIAQREWERDYPNWRGHPATIIDYMASDKSLLSPVMTGSDLLRQMHNNAYSKPAVALNVLRETVMGRELFDFAFKEYARRWQFKHPTPEDFFRTMEDASAVDLDWFWRGWFFSTDHVDIAINNVKVLKVTEGDPEVELAFLRKENTEKPMYIAEIRDKGKMSETDRDADLRDFYTTYDPFNLRKEDKMHFTVFQRMLSKNEQEILKRDYFYYEIDFKNVGGLVSPLILKFEYADDTYDVVKIPVEIWRLDNEHVTKVFPMPKEVKQITLDPFMETVDVDLSNNYWPQKMQPSRLQLYKRKMQDKRNPMQQAGNQR